MRLGVVILVGFVFGIETYGFCEDENPSTILDKVAAKYQEMQTYKSEGTTVSDMDMDGRKMKIETTFTMKLKKPNLYLITWKTKNMPMPGMENSGAVWNAGDQAYFYMGAMKAYFKGNSDEMALASATGISNGTAMTIPSLFLNVFKERHGWFSNLINLKMENDEKIEDEDCFVISGGSKTSKKETLWISKERLVLVKYSRSLEPPEGGYKMPEMNDEQVEKSLKEMGEKVTEENKQNMKSMMEKARESMNKTKIKGTVTELHKNRSLSELKKADFEFKLPEGTNLKKSLIGAASENSE